MTEILLIRSGTDANSIVLPLTHTERLSNNPQIVGYKYKDESAERA